MTFNTYMTIYMWVSVFGLGFACIHWSKNGLLNTFVKSIMGALALFGAMILAKGFM